MKKIVIFASGNGSNAEKIIAYFEKSKLANVVAVLSNNTEANILEKAKNLNVTTATFSKIQLNDGYVLNYLKELQPDLIVLAGFLLQFPKSIIVAFPNKIINIHPALLPNYGGKGMYGMHVHRKVLENKEKESGITIHYVNENYDEGDFILQERINIEDSITPEEIAAKIHILEHLHFSKAIEELLINY